MSKEEFSCNFEDQTPRNKALVTAIANVYYNGDVEAAWAAIAAQPGPEDLPPLEEPEDVAHVQARFAPGKTP